MRETKCQYCESRISKKFDAKKPKHKLDGYCCPKCDKLIYKFIDNYCHACGQRIDWSEYTKWEG